MMIALDSSRARHAGRVYFSGEKLWLTHSAASCGFVFTGKQLTITLGCDSQTVNGPRCNKPRMAILVDGRIVVRKVIETEKESFTVIDSPEPVTREITVVKLSEMAFSLCCLYPAQTDEGAQIVPAAAKSRRIAFIGDSITCGYGVDDSNLESAFATEAENAMKSYAWLTCQLMDAEPSLYSYSGHGIISGYTEDGVRNTREILLPWYESLGFSYGRIDGKAPEDIPWEFSAAPADIVVINLGTNDDSFCRANPGGYEEFEEGYLSFLKTVRRSEPEALIVCTIGIMETGPVPYIKRAAERSGDDRVVFFQSTNQDGSLGYGSNWHPSELTQQKAAEELAGFLSSCRQLF